MATSSDTGISEVRISTMSGSVAVTAEAGRDEIEVDGLQPEADDGVVTIDTKSKRVKVRIPEGLDLVIGTTSGSVRVDGRVGSVAATSTSGRITVDDADSVDLRGLSGRITVGRSRGETRIVGKSGRITVDETGPADVTTTSGKVTLHSVDGPVAVNCVSGTIQIEMASAHDVAAETVSGRVVVSLPPGTRARVDTPSSGRIPVDGDVDCVVTARSFSGRVDVRSR